jgi:hypothetical protein
MKSPAANGADMVRNCSAVLDVKEKVYLKQICNLLMFESGNCALLLENSNILNIHKQVKCVLFKQKCNFFDIASNFFCDTLSHLPIHASQKWLIKPSSLYDEFSAKLSTRGWHCGTPLNVARQISLIFGC